MPDYVQTNVNLTSEDVAMLDRMMAEDAIENRSAEVRRLIRQEWARRFSQPNPLITVEEAQAAAALRAPEGEPASGRGDRQNAQPASQPAK